MRQQALAFAEKVVAGQDRPEADWVRDIYQLTLNRAPSQEETARALEFVGAYALVWDQAKPVTPQLVAATASTEENTNTDTGAATAVAGQAANPDDVDRNGVAAKEDPVEPKSAGAAAWMNFIQALYASAEFRFVR